MSLRESPVSLAGAALGLVGGLGLLLTYAGLPRTR